MKANRKSTKPVLLTVQEDQDEEMLITAPEPQPKPEECGNTEIQKSESSNHYREETTKKMDGLSTNLSTKVATSIMVNSM